MKARNEELIQRAYEALQVSKILQDGKINEAYKGCTAALPVSIAMIGLRPALVVYFQEKEKSKAKKREVLNIIAAMLKQKYAVDDAQSLLKLAIDDTKNAVNESLQSDVINCAIALKHVIRTYKLVKDEKQST